MKRRWKKSLKNMKVKRTDNETAWKADVKRLTILFGSGFFLAACGEASDSKSFHRVPARGLQDTSGQQHHNHKYSCAATSDAPACPLGWSLPSLSLALSLFPFWPAAALTPALDNTETEAANAIDFILFHRWPSWSCKK